MSSDKISDEKDVLPFLRDHDCRNSCSTVSEYAQDVEVGYHCNGGIGSQSSTQMVCNSRPDSKSYGFPSTVDKQMDYLTGDDSVQKCGCGKHLNDSHDESSHCLVSSETSCSCKNCKEKLTTISHSFSNPNGLLSNSSNSDLLSDTSASGLHLISLFVEDTAIESTDFQLKSSSKHHETSENVSEGLCSTVSSFFSTSFLFSLSRRDKLILACLAVIDLMSQMCLSIMAPFFPAEAIDKGVSNTMSGWIFGVFALVQFIASPIFGKVLPHFGSRFLITAGQFFSGGCVILFGFLDDLPDNGDSRVFIGYCFVLRIFLALGCTASATASFAVTASAFPNNVATVFGLLETATGLGLMVGPALGGLLYQVGGFRLPFLVLGGLMLLTVPANYLMIPEKDVNNHLNVRSVSVLQILRIPAIIVVCLSVIVAALIWSIFDPTLAPHLEQFNVSSAVLGLLFLLMSSFYAVFSPIWGWLADRMDDCSPMLVVGFFLSAIGLLLLGPSPWIGFSEDDNYMWLNVISLVVLGISVSLALVPTFDKILDAVEKAGIDESFAMYSVVSGIWGSCYALGDFLGPTMGGWLVDAYGFPLCMSYTAVVCCAMGIVVLLLWLRDRFCLRQVLAAGDVKPLNDVTTFVDASTEERTPLLMEI